METTNELRQVSLFTENYLQKFKSGRAPRNEREEVLEKFLTRLNADRALSKIPPLTPGRLVRMFTGVPTGDLYPFYKECENARSFSRLFWYKFKETKV